MSKTLPIRRNQFKTAEFAAWLATQGAEVGMPTNQYEVIRYRAYAPGGLKADTHIVYAKESGLLTFSGGTRTHYEAFMAGENIVGMFVSQYDVAALPNSGPAPRSITKPSKAAVSRDKLLARDGNECWFCGTSMGDDMTIEHLVPKSKGGGNRLDNYALAHQKCNALAADKPLVAKIELRASLRARTPETSS